MSLNSPPSKPIKEPSLHLRARATAQEATAKLCLPIRSGLRGSSGNIPGSNSGSSIDFQDHRAYVPGDDPRHIDWQAYARSGHYTMKLYREEIRPLVDLAVDGSSSMFLGQAKALRSLELAYFCMACAARGAGAMRAFSVQGQQVSPVEAHGQFPRTSQGRETGEAPIWSRVPWRTGSLRVVVSDLLHPSEPALTPLLADGGQAVVFVPYSQEEEDPDWLGNAELVDCETGRCEDHDFRYEDLNHYRKAYRNHFANWEREARRHGVPFARISSEPSLLEALASGALPIGAVSLLL